MKISNIDLAFGLMAANPFDLPEDCQKWPKSLTAFAQYLAERPQSPQANKTGRELLGLDVPQESHRDPMPEIEAGRDKVAEEIGRLNAEYDKSPLHARCALVRVAWACKALAWRLEYETERDQFEIIRKNRGLDKLFLRNVELKELEYIAYRELVTRNGAAQGREYAYRPKAGVANPEPEPAK